MTVSSNQERNSEPYSDRKDLTFAQAEGAEALPSQLALRQISPELSAVLWAVVHDSLEKSVTYGGGYGGGSYLTEPWKPILRTWWVLRLHKNIDELPNVGGFMTLVKATMTSRDYVKVFDFLQFVIQRPECPHGFPKSIDMLLQMNHAAYRVIEKMIVPITSDEQAEAIRGDMEIARLASARGPHSHLRNASVALSSGNWAEAIRESIHAVEASAKSIEPSADALGPALAKLKGSIGLNPALAKAYTALYGYSSDEKGIRHALVFSDVADVNERDAMFMFGACAAFVGYLLSAHA